MKKFGFSGLHARETLAIVQHVLVLFLGGGGGGGV